MSGLIPNSIVSQKAFDEIVAIGETRLHSIYKDRLGIDYLTLRIVENRKGMVVEFIQLEKDKHGNYQRFVQFVVDFVANFEQK